MVVFIDRSESIFVVTVVFLIISFVSVCLRCFVRIRLVKAFGWDDTLMVLAMALNILFALCGIVGSLNGMGRKFEHIEPADLHIALFWWWLGQGSYVITVVVAKVSIAMALLRLTVARLHKILLWVVIAASVAVGLVFWLILIFECNPVPFFWHRTGPGTCLSTDAVIGVCYLYSITATLSDLVLGILPIFLIWQLQMSPKTKMALAGILSLGCIASAAVIIRIPYLHLYKDPEFLYATTEISIWSNVEAGLGITAGSLVTLRPLFRLVRGSSYQGTPSGKNTYGSFPLSSMNGGNTNHSKNDRSASRGWRPDLYPDESHGIVTTVQTSLGSKNSSQEDLNPRPQIQGVNVQKTFYVSSDAV